MSIISTDINKAAQILHRDELVAIPTETVYGLAANACSEIAVHKIFALKQRPFFNPLIVHIHSMKQLNELVIDIPAKAKILAETFWPGPLTLLLKKKNSIPDVVTANKNTVAIRMPDHPLTLQLLKQLPFPLAAPSANPFGRISPTTAKHVEDYFGDQLELILDGGPCRGGIESTIIGFDHEEVIVYRLGTLPLEKVEATVGPVQLLNKKNEAPPAPGMLDKHYSPRTKMILTEDVETEIKKQDSKKIGVLNFKYGSINQQVVHQEILSANGDMQEAAASLYSSLHQLDALGLDVIIAERLPDTGLGLSINDRLERAAKGE